MKVEQIMKKIVAIISIVALILVGVLCYILESGSYVAKVHNQKIKKYEYLFFLSAQKHATESEAGVVDELDRKKLWGTPFNGEDPTVIVMNQALENVKEFKVQLIKAEESGFSMSDSERREIIKNLDKWLEDAGNKSYITNDLGLKPAQFKDMMLKSELVIRFADDFMQKERDSISVSEKEAEEYYYENRNYIDDVTVMHILLSIDENMTKDQKLEKRQLADSLLQRVEQGENMLDLVKEYSDDEVSKDGDGLYTFSYSGQYARELKEWAFNAQIGDLDLVETQFGYHVIRLENRSTFENKKEHAINAVKDYKLNLYYQNSVKEWVKDPAFNLKKNEDVLNRITKKTFEN
jgi:foldase protein PrsA